MYATAPVKKGVLKRPEYSTAGPTPKKTVQFSSVSAAVHYYSPEKKGPEDFAIKFLASLARSSASGSTFEMISFDDLPDDDKPARPAFSIFSPLVVKVCFGLLGGY